MQHRGRPSRPTACPPHAHTPTSPPRPQATLAAATTALQGALADAAPLLGSCSSGAARFEVPLPRGASALQWLHGQPSQAALQLYFSGRSSTAPDTPGTAAAEQHARTFTATAAHGAAWRWQGEPGAPFSAATMAGMQRFLSPSCPRVRVLGGMRFNPQQAPDVEWEAFGSHCFLLPLLEFTEAADCCLLAVTVAWDGRLPQHAGSNGAAPAAGAAGAGAAHFGDALAAAAAALGAMQPPAPASAPGFRLRPAAAAAAGGAAAADGAALLAQHTQHTPSREQWSPYVADLLSQLIPDASLRFPLPGMAALDTDLAREEFMSAGQQVGFTQRAGGGRAGVGWVCGEGVGWAAGRAGGRVGGRASERLCSGCMHARCSMHGWRDPRHAGADMPPRPPRAAAFEPRLPWARDRRAWTTCSPPSRARQAAAAAPPAAQCTLQQQQQHQPRT